MIRWETPNPKKIKNSGTYLIWNDGYDLIETYGANVKDLLVSPNVWQRPKWISEVTKPKGAA